MSEQDGWKWSKDCECWYIADFNQPPRYYCLGERFVYAHYGLDSYGILYRGSTIENWGGYHFGYDLKEAIDWVKGATRPELGHKPWKQGGMKRLEWV